MQQKVELWSYFTRFYHWLQLLLLCGLWWSAEAGALQWHFRLGYGLLALWLCRIIWGFFGDRYSRFSQFIRGPKTVLQYLRGQNKQPYLGHNPAGAYMIVLLLSVLGLQLLTGLANADELLSEGPLYAYVSELDVELAGYSIEYWVAWLHQWNFKLLLGLAAVHIGAVLIYGIFGHNLLSAMLTGYKDIENIQNNFKIEKTSIFSQLWPFLLFVFLTLLFLFWLPLPI